MEGDYFGTGCGKFKFSSNTAGIRLVTLKKISGLKKRLIEYIRIIKF